MFNRIFEMLVVLLFAMIIASSCVSLSPFLFPGIAETFFCPEGGELTVSSYSEFALSQDRSGIYFECMEKNNTASTIPHNYLQGYWELTAIFTAVLVFPMYFLFRRIVNGPKISTVKKKTSNRRQIPA